MKGILQMSVGFVICFLATWSVVVPRSSAAAGFPPSTEPSVALVTATADELKPVVALMGDDVHEHRIHGHDIYTGRIDGHEIIATATGGGKTNAGATTMLVILTCHPRFVIMTGTAGGMSNELHPGDIVIAEQTAQSDYGTQRDTGFTARGTPDPVDGSTNPISIPSDQRLLECARKVPLDKLDLTPIAIDSSEDKHRPSVIFGTIVSNDVFSYSPKLCQQVRRLFHADAMDMESASAAQICYQQQVAFLAVRGITDQGNEQSGPNYERWRRISAANAANVSVGIIRSMLKEGTSP
jgi:adenosylhomocysteine nucleosidase